MRRIFLLFLILPLFVKADDKAVALLNKAVAHIWSELPVKMNFKYRMYVAGELQYNDAGEMILADAGRYLYSLAPMKMWCDGERQWSYMAQTNEIYITSADSDEGRNFSPLYLMQLYKEGYEGSVIEIVGRYIITLTAKEEAEFDRVDITLNNVTMQVEALELHTAENEILIVINEYSNKVKVSEELFRCPLDEFPDAEIINMID